MALASVLAPLQASTPHRCAVRAALLVAIMAVSGGVVRHIIVMDAQGRNVAVPLPTTDYFQGDEAKWLAVFGRTSGTRHVAPRQRGHDGSFVACWISEPLNDPKTDAPLGALSIELAAKLVPERLCSVSL